MHPEAAPTRRERWKTGRFEARLQDHLDGPGQKHYTVGDEARGESARIGNFP